MILRLPVALTVILSLATVAFSGSTRSGGRKCGNQPTPEEINERESRFTDALSRAGNSSRTTTGFSNYTIPVYFHVINSGSKLQDGRIPDQQIRDQITVLNRDFNGTGLSFKLVNTTRTTNARWFEAVAQGSTEQTEMKKKLRRGGPETLNLYTVSFNNTDTLGYSTFPGVYQSAPMDDGVVILYSTLPGSTYVPYNLGRTTTHEVGHWVGLYHTFQGGCDGQGDFVSDTAPEESPALGCPSKRDTCISKSGLDPIHNFMDYTDDSCMNSFTKGQTARLRDQISIYRKIPL